MGQRRDKQKIFLTERKYYISRFWDELKDYLGEIYALNVFQTQLMNFDYKVMVLMYDLQIQYQVTVILQVKPGIYFSILY